MASPRMSRARRTVAGLLGSAAVAALLPLSLAGAASAATPAICTSSSHPALAARLSRDIHNALAGRTDTVAVNVWDPNTGVSCDLHSSWHFDSASVVKATIMGAVLRRAQDQKRGLTSWESSNLYYMITQSDNTAASNLWASLGRARFQSFLNLTGMSSTAPGPGGYWGLTQITARDEMRLMNAFTDNHTVLTAGWRAYALNLMARVESSQRWGTPYGTPRGVTAHNKNGWLPRATHGWRVHSIGIFTGNGRNYRMSVLTQDNGTMGYGINTIDAVALAVHRNLGGSLAKAAMVTPQTAPGATGTGDGSAPFGTVTE